MPAPDNKKSQTRTITVCSKAFERANKERYALFPVLSLSGKWLQDSGFKIGHVVNIACEEGRLIITLSEKQPYVDV